MLLLSCGKARSEHKPRLIGRRRQNESGLRTSIGVIIIMEEER
jgi:hypothetical protein